MRTNPRSPKRNRWRVWFAWRPVHLEPTPAEEKRGLTMGAWVWLEYVERRNVGGLQQNFYRDIFKANEEIEW